MDHVAPGRINDLNSDKIIVRFDDVCVNSDITRTIYQTGIAQTMHAQVWWCISPLVHIESITTERVFPAIFKALSDQRCFYHVDKMGLPPIPMDVIACSHGLLHMDHRLLGYEAQELSILVSCSLIKTAIFVPPFNKWNADTEVICNTHHIELIKFEDGWRSMEYHNYVPDHKLWYLHGRNFTLDAFRKWWVSDNSHPST